MAQELLNLESLQQRLAGLTKLVKVTCELAAEHDLDKILQIVTSGVCSALSCERASLYLYDENREELYTRVATELEIEEIRSSIETGITGWVARERRVAVIPDPHVDARWNSSIDRKTGFQTRNILAAPVISPVSSRENKLVGVLQLLNKADGCFDEFDEQLVCAFASHAATAVERAQLLEEARHSHELQASINLARSIQSSFLPDELPDVPGYEVAAWWQPNEAVGGDYYDILELPDGRLGLVIADVSGHGIGPSLIMASARAMLHVAAQTLSDPAEILSLLSESIYIDLKMGRFITCLIAALDPQAHKLTYANAGHGPAMHFERKTGQFRQLSSTALPLGVVRKIDAEHGPVVSIMPGDLLLLATDGAIEVRNEQDEMFGRERLERLIAQNPTLPAPKLRDLLRDAITDFHPHTHPPDDVTLLLLERKL